MLRIVRTVTLQISIYLLLMSMAGCSSIPIPGMSKPFELPPERTQDMPVAPITPHHSDLMGDPLHVIFAIETVNQDQLAIKNQLESGIYSGLSEAWVRVRKAGSNNNQKSFQEEIAIARRQSNDREYQGVQKTNYILIGQLETSEFKERYNPPGILCTSWKDDCMGSCDYSMRATFAMEAEILPEKRRSKRWMLQAKEEDSLEANGRCPARNQNEAHNLYLEMLDEVVADLVSCSSNALKDYFASRGYVTEYYSDGQRHIFAVSAGESSGLSKGDSVQLDNLVERGDGSVEFVEIAKGTVVKSSEKNAYIEVSTADHPGDIQRYARVKGKKPWSLDDLTCRTVMQ